MNEQEGLPAQEEGEEEAEEEDYFLERVMDTLRKHPDLLTELMQGKCLSPLSPLCCLALMSFIYGACFCETLLCLLQVY